ncbi:MAG: 3-dehydroquinate synthase [Lachnospiraceae bacterium]|nr:3-dehydroquinate synthase [Lachnospiraceae bacterium]
MNIIDVSTASPYPVITGCGLLEETGEYIKHYVPRAETVAVITDDTVAALYGDRITASLRAAGLRVIRCVIPHGEASKTAAAYLEILQFLAQEQLTRSDAVVALGGGVVGDLAGFAAATYLRGIDYVQIPTTLLAQVDSSVGGKTAVDLPAGKNLAGAFYQPRLVLCDAETLRTLPAHVFADGCAEVIKYGILWDEDLFEHLRARGTDFDREYVIPRCIELKRDVVVEDEFDRGSRRLLNLGHTLAHAVEKLSDYRISHGNAVAMGIAAITRAAAEQGYCSRECAGRIEEILLRFGLPAGFEDSEVHIGINDIYESVLADKKRRGGRISLIIPREIGDCEIRTMSLEEMKVFLEAAL